MNVKCQNSFLTFKNFQTIKNSNLQENNSLSGNVLANDKHLTMKLIHF